VGLWGLVELGVAPKGSQEMVGASGGGALGNSCTFFVKQIIYLKRFFRAISYLYNIGMGFLSVPFCCLSNCFFLFF